LWIVDREEKIVRVEWKAAESAHSGLQGGSKRQEAASTLRTAPPLISEPGDLEVAAPKRLLIPNLRDWECKCSGKLRFAVGGGSLRHGHETFAGTGPPTTNHNWSSFVILVSSFRVRWHWSSQDEQRCIPHRIEYFRIAPDVSYHFISAMTAVPNNAALSSPGRCGGIVSALCHEFRF
jgi:hypothetical protein